MGDKGKKEQNKKQGQKDRKKDNIARKKREQSEKEVPVVSK